MRFLKVLFSATFVFAATVTVGHATPVPNKMIPALMPARGTAGISSDSFKLTKRATPGWNDPNCKPTAAHPNPLILLHGLGSQGDQHWSVFGPQFAARGYCVYGPTYGSVPGQTVVNGLDTIENSGKQLSEYIDKVLASTGASRVNIVGHSEGSTLMQYYLLKMDGAKKVERVAGIGGNYRGTDIQGLTEFAKTVGLYDEGSKAISPFCKACTELITGSDFLKDLNANGDTVPGIKYLNIVTNTEIFVTPKESGFLLDKNPSVRNVYLQDLCLVDLSDHIALMASPVVFAALHAHFDDSANQKVDCTAVFTPPTYPPPPPPPPHPYP
ncbi:hypothetical protein BGZ73_008429 [Actinomortierella ambigua]|nr:hypothetical protein BGZ73_008429 [Actinomortierella ambigua]